MKWKQKHADHNTIKGCNNVEQKCASASTVRINQFFDKR